MYLWERPEWPHLRWDEQSLSPPLVRTSREQGRLLGRMEALGFDLRSEAHLRTLTEDVVKSSEIEGEKLERDQVRSSIARRLGMDVGGLLPADRAVEGIVELMLDAAGNYASVLTEEQLFAWHAALFPSGRSGMRKIVVGAWRDDRSGRMQVVSGPLGKEKVHYEAPPAASIPNEMGSFLRWFADPGTTDPLLVAGLAHLRFVTIHPFDDGNGRLARAIGELALARAEGSAQRFYSLSAQIERERSDYYLQLERSQRGSLDSTAWLEWFLGCLTRALESAHATIDQLLQKGRFWQQWNGGAATSAVFNPRQIKLINRLLDGFDGKLTSQKWAAIAKCSNDTALRDINQLRALGVLGKSAAGGRSTGYALVACVG